MRAFIADPAEVRETRSLEDIRAARAEGKLVWVDLESRTPDAEALLADTFQIHGLTLDDIWADRASPKVEEFEGYLYILVHAAARGEQPGTIELRELDLVIGKDFVVTHDHTGETCNDLRDDLVQAPRVLARGTAWLAHTVLDHLVDAYMPLIDGFDEEIEDLEDDVLAKAGTREGNQVLSRILGVKRSMQALRRVSVRQREVLLRLARGEFHMIPEEALPYFRNVHDHFLRVGDLAESYRDLVTSTLEAYLSVQSNRMNQVMKTLALISTVLLPITFIAGVYGMNFEDMPLQHAAGGFEWVVGGMAAVALGAFLWFRYKKWLD